MDEQHDFFARFRNRKKGDNDELKTLFQTKRRPTRKGLSPVSLLTSVTTHQVQVLSWLMRQKEATLEEIKAAVDAKVDVAKVLKGLKLEGRISESIQNGELHYRVIVASSDRSDHQERDEALGEVWSRIDQDKVRFLRELDLFKLLSAEQVADVADQMVLREYERNDVLVWQGQTSELLHIIKSGVVAVSYLTADMQDAQILAYLDKGDTLGEYNLITDEEFTATASARALSRVETMQISHEAFRTILKNHPNILWEMSRRFVRRLIRMNPKRNEASTRLSVVVGVTAESGRTALGRALARQLGRDRKAVYTEYPSTHKLAGIFGVAQQDEQVFYPTEEGFDIAITNLLPGLPVGLRMTMLQEQLVTHYANVVVGISDRLDEGVIFLLERAQQVVIIGGPDEESWQQVREFSRKIRPYLHPEKASVMVIVNRYRPEYVELPRPVGADFDLPYLADFSAQSESLIEAAGQIADRLGRTNQVSLFIPTTVDVDQEIDTTTYVQRTLAFLGERFGGATSSEAQGVWNSEEVGLVAEKVYIVRSYASKTALDEHLPQILNYVEKMKAELSQEAMAVEVNQKLMLI